MLQQKSVEIGVGMLIVLGMAALLVLGLKVSNLSEFTPQTDTYHLSAKFENIGALKVRSPVSVAGVRIGRVSAIGFDDASEQAVVTLDINKKYDRLPQDTTASIFTAGLLGEQYIGLEPGGDTRFLKNGSEIKLTQSALVLEQLIGQFLFNKAADSKPEPAKTK